MLDGLVCEIHSDILQERFLASYWAHFANNENQQPAFFFPLRDVLLPEDIIKPRRAFLGDIGQRQSQQQYLIFLGLP
jgi:hypothetical protein